MYIGYDSKQEALRKELRDYYENLLTPEIRDALAAEEGTGPVREIVGQMGRDGWLTVGWPEEYGGRGYSAVEQFVMFDESVAIGANPDADREYRRAHAHAVRVGGTESVLPPQDFEGRNHVLCRLLRA